MLSEDVRTINDQVVIQKDPIHSCFACPKVFTHKWMLERHMLTHTGEQPFACSICLRKFSLQASCLRHVRHVHKNVGGLISNYVVKASDLETENTQPSMQCWKDTKQNWKLLRVEKNSSKCRDDSELCSFTEKMSANFTVLRLRWFWRCERKAKKRCLGTFLLEQKSWGV